MPWRDRGQVRGSRAGGLAIAALLALVLAFAHPPDAGARVVWVVKGGGYGHGVGMSAYGAYGFGKHGRGYRQILGHYYRGIRVVRVRRPQLVRVLLSTSSGDVLFSKATAACGRRLRPSRVYRAHRNGGSVRLQTRRGRQLARCGRRLHADSAGQILIRGLGAYRGALAAVPGGSGLYVVNHLNVNNYARGSIPSEVPPAWPMSTLRAFAVAIRSIALSTDVGGTAFDLYADTRTQVYEGVEVESRRTDLAVRSTLSEVAKYHGAVAQTTYFSSSGGRTESGFLGGPEVPYLQSVRDPYDHYSPQHRWTFRFTQAEMNLRLGGYVPGSLRRIVVTKRGDSPRIDYARLVGTRGAARIRGDTLAAALGLYDRWAYFRKVRR